MKKLLVKKLNHNQENTVLSQFSEQLEANTEANVLDQLNWKDWPYHPDVKFRIAHLGDQVLLKFYVKEKSVRAETAEINGDVYKDSCVEFFISPNADGNYYNFEFNCIGVPHVGYGPGRHDRQPVDPEILKKIKTYSTLGTENFSEKKGGFEWELTVLIPIKCFVHDEISRMDKIQAKGNFYKCGDELETPHFITWNAVGTENPDYHQYPFFGDIVFE